MAIAYDNAVVHLVTTQTTNATSLIVTGSNLAMLVGIFNTSGDTLTGITATKGGIATAMTQLRKRAGLTSEEMYLYGILGPDAGTNSVSATFSSGNISRMHVATYTGVSQSGLPDAVNDGSVLGATSGTGNITTIADNAWEFLFVRAADNLSASTGSTERPSPQTTTSALFDSNSPLTPAGVKNMSYTVASGVMSGWIMVSLAPALTGGATLPFKSLLGVGV